jgi:zinc/manganese transport system permease protein
VVPALATWYARERRLLKGYAIGALGYALGLLASLEFDLPSGPAIVCAIAALGLLGAGLGKFFAKAAPA